MVRMDDHHIEIKVVSSKQCEKYDRADYNSYGISEEAITSSTSFLKDNNPAKSQEGSTTRRSRSSSMFQAVFSAMRVSRKNSGKSQNGSVAGTPLNIRREMSSSSDHCKNSPATKRQMWAISRFAEKVNKSEGDPTSSAPVGEICLISDGPNYIFKLADKGDDTQIATLCNARPERLLSRDSKGATILHHAAAKGHTKVIDFVLADQQGLALLDAQDDKNATPLHWAIAADNEIGVEYLLSRGANPTIANNNGECPIHTCVRMQSVNAMNTLIKHKGIINLNERMNTSGNTPLHIAAIVDSDEIARLLLESGAKPCIGCNLGYRPLHSAALNGSLKVMEVILERCEASGYTRQDILSFNDKELCSALHCAVTGGNLETIKMCLSYGARLDKQQADLSTPMHVVCAQGAFDIVKQMFDLAREQAIKTMSIQDKQKHTPLHKAAMYGHAVIVRYLVEQGANMDLLDGDHNSPLLLAATRGNWDCVHDLIELGSSILLRNTDDRNLMHMIVLKGGDIRNLETKSHRASFKSDKFKSILYKVDVLNLLNDADSFGCTPLHYACQEGNLASLDTLMKLGVSAKPKSVGNQSPLHFAAMYGRYNACKRLINSPQGPNIINEKDSSGMTPLHFAAQNGHLKVVRLLLNRGAVFHRTSCGRSVLHVAAVNGYNRTIRILIEMNRTLLDQTDEEGNTSLHIASRSHQVSTVCLLLDLHASILRNKQGATFFSEAIQNENREIALAIVEHDRWEEAMQTCCRNEGAPSLPTLLLIQYLPDIWVVAMNRCIQTADTNPKRKDYWIKYQFKYLQPNVNNRDEIKKTMKAIINTDSKSNAGNSAEVVALPALNRMVQFNRVDCLRHPVSVAYLRMKWNAYGRWVHGLNLFIYMLGLFPMTYLICTMDTQPHDDFDLNSNSSTIHHERLKYSVFQFTMMILLTILSVCQMVKEVIQMMQQKKKYFLDFTNAVEWILYLSSLLFVVPFLSGYPVHWQYECGAIAILLAWFNLLLFLRRFDLAGIYVVMFLEIFKTLIKVILVFSFMLVAFSLSFYVLMRHENDKAFKNPGLAFMRIFTMTLGEIGYTESFLEPYVDGDDNTLHFPVPSMILLIVFILVMPILLMNLLIGLAVGDIAEVQNNASLQRLAMQVELHTDIEGKLSTRILRHVDKEELIVYPNGSRSNYMKFWNFVEQSSIIENSTETVTMADRNINYLNVEIQKQKQRIKTIQASLTKQHDLLRLIVQKMEIRSEADDQDEGFDPEIQRRLQSNRSRTTVGSKIMAVRAFKSVIQ